MTVPTPFRSDVPVSSTQPSVNIIVLNWNGCAVTEDCLNSLKKTNYSALDVIVVDNGSTDGSPAYLRETFPYITVIENERNIGFCAGNNIGIRAALSRNPDFIVLLNNDTVVSPGFLSKLINVALTDVRIGLLNPKIYYYDHPERLWYAGGAFSHWSAFARHSRVESWQDEQEKVVDVTFITGCAFMIRTSVIRKIGLLDENLVHSCEDTDLTIRVLKAGYRAVYVPASVIWHKESWTVKRNVGKAFRDYYNIRNALLVARKHSRVYHWPFFTAALFGVIAYRTAGYAARREWRRIQALYRGFWHGISFKRQPGADRL